MECANTSPLSYKAVKGKFGFAFITLGALRFSVSTFFQLWYGVEGPIFLRILWSVVTYFNRLLLHPVYKNRVIRNRKDRQKMSAPPKLEWSQKTNHQNSLLFIWHKCYVMFLTYLFIYLAHYRIQFHVQTIYKKFINKWQYYCLRALGNLYHSTQQNVVKIRAIVWES